MDQAANGHLTGRGDARAKMIAMHVEVRLRGTRIASSLTSGPPILLVALKDRGALTGVEVREEPAAAQLSP